MVAKLTEAIVIFWLGINVIVTAWFIAVYITKTLREKGRGK
jgi:hypothetical protein